MTEQHIIDSVIEFQRSAAMHYASARLCVQKGTSGKLKIAVWHQQHAQYFSAMVMAGMEALERLKRNVLEGIE